MRCPICKTCISAIKKGHIACVMTFDYEKCNNALIEAAKTKQLDIYNALILNPPMGLNWDTLGAQLILNDWTDQYCESFRPFFQVSPEIIDSTRKRHVRNIIKTCVKDNNLPALTKYAYARNIATNDWDERYFYMEHYGYHSPGPRILDSYRDDDDMTDLMELAIKTKNTEMITEIYGWFQNRSYDWNCTDFDFAVETGDMSVLLHVVELWGNSEGGMWGVGVEMKLATIKKNRLDMLKLLDDFIPGIETSPRLFYPESMMHNMTTTRGRTTRDRKKMISYVSQKIRALERERLLREAERIQQNINMRLLEGIRRREEYERIEQRQATAEPVAPAQERVTNLQKALSLIEDCDIPEGTYLEICKYLMDVHRNGVM